jgi:hypothetical protein
LRALVIPESVKLVLEVTSEGDSQTYGNEISDVLQLAAENRSQGMGYGSPGPPRGISVWIHDMNAPITMKGFATQIAKVFGASGFVNDNIHAPR